MEHWQKRKDFDQTMSFSVFGTWVDAIERIKKAQGTEAAYALFEAIANYSMYYDTPNFEADSLAQMVWPLIQREIDISLKRRGVNFSSEEAKEREQQVIELYSENPSLSIRDIEKMTGVSKSAVGRILKKLKPNAPEKEKEKETEIETEVEIDTTGQRWDGTVGQQEMKDVPHIPLLDKITDYLYDKHDYSGGMTVTDEGGTEGFEIDPALFYIPPDAPKSSDAAADDQEMPF